MKKMRIVFVGIAILFSAYIYSNRDIIFEFKGAYFLPTNAKFRDCYAGNALFGPELTFQFCPEKNWYGFTSIDFLLQKGRFLHSCDTSRLFLMPLALGVKYFVPCNHADFYMGLGFQADYLSKKNRNKCITFHQNIWGFGGVGKIGGYIHLPHNLELNLFFNYQFVWSHKDNFYGSKTSCLRTNASSAVFGGSLGYKF